MEQPLAEFPEWTESSQGTLIYEILFPEVFSLYLDFFFFFNFRLKSPQLKN